MVEYRPTWGSLDRHPVPEWYNDAKLGIFIHWGVYSVPAWAPTDGEIGGEDDSSYAEWYPYHMYRDGSATQTYHEETYGEDIEYADFIDDWEAENWDPEEWASLFDDVGAGYVVLTGEHHDGFPLWHSHYTKYNAAEMGPERDLVGDLAEAVREYGLKFAASYHANYNYYQPGFEGQFGHPDFEPGEPAEDQGGPGPEYVDFMNAKHRELIRKYDPDLLWFDVPKAESDHLNARELIADYYNQAIERGQAVAVNDRASTDAIGPTINIENEGPDAEYHGDFITPEYTSYDEIQEDKWETCRGIGHSFGYNAAEDEDSHLSTAELIHSFVDIVAKNGNLLLNVGPRADGTIPELQRRPLVGLGEWLDVNGEAIFGSRPWTVAEDEHADTEVRYTHRDDTLYAITFGWPGDTLQLDIPTHVTVSNPPTSALLTETADVRISVTECREQLSVELPERPDHDHAYTIRFDGIENPR
ncbi:Alpha-L-fucosidase [Halorubrum sp. DM2]|uniref:alpha-L-fucosidase n=1 Tax=Halorubrum sp. DM2 TaxID=2527867 RepID=UPI0024B743C4|nr:alpha-L-fucosidase [Halorubrum sp. DM2]VTT86210.1 Alpha-L-fucosidase [Halorubrum sp. DM2]